MKKNKVPKGNTDIPSVTGSAGEMHGALSSLYFHRKEIVHFCLTFLSLFIKVYNISTNMIKTSKFMQNVWKVNFNFNITLFFYKYIYYAYVSFSRLVHYFHGNMIFVYHFLNVFVKWHDKEYVCSTEFDYFLFNKRVLYFLN